MSQRPSGPWPRGSPEEHVTRAVKALAAGVANEGQQKTVLRWIIEEIAATYGLSYQPKSDRDTAFMEGRRYVGLQIVQEINITEEGLERRTHGRAEK